METQALVPNPAKALSALVRADFTAQWRNRRSFILVLIVPVLILFSWKGLISKVGAPFVLSNCLTIGLIAIGLMGYSNSIARDRDKAIFQRLRVAPIPSSFIMISRLLVQLAMITLMTLAVFIGGIYLDKIKLDFLAYFYTFFLAILGGALYLSLGQAIVGRITNPETVNSTTRLVYFLFIMVGMFGELGVLGDKLKNLVFYSPYGSVKTVLSSSLNHSWNIDSSIALLITIGYTLVLSILGIRWFKWNTR